MSLLNDITVLELGNNISAPLVGQILAEFGANVIKVEPPDGDDRRKVKPEIDGISVYFASVNKGKKSVVINLKNEKGLEIFYKLVSNSNVIVTNYRPSALKRLKIDYEGLLKYNPKIIYCSITGFGNFSPMANMPAYDATILSLSGLLDMTGEENPVKFATSISDITTALLATTAILASIHKGGPTFLDVPMLPSQFYLTLEDIYMMLNLGIIPRRMGSEHRYLVPYKAFKTKDGNYIFVAVFNDEQYQRLCNALGRSDLLRFETIEERSKNRDYINKELEKIFMTKERDYWVKVLKDADVPLAPVLNLKEAFDIYGKDLEVKQGEMSYVKFPINIDGVRRGAPKLGEDTVEVLKSLGYNEEELRKFKEEGVIDYPS